ncbi:hypothetical protein P5673_022487 [Acropora cervicornis]|uniref:Uncharacterized protein n=1 Tax=Acropora cervicornis TaxID=6130 RepID=A0AAD9UZN5_ACRCE|nr:hypothetical protein P5673_022487 [Acropora cervicornis]
MAKEIKARWNTVVPVGAGICRNCRGAHADNMEKDDLDSDVVTGSSVPSESPVLSGEEAMDQTPGPSGEQETKEMPETAEEEPVLPRLHVRFQEEFLSQQSDPNSDILSSSSQGSSAEVETSHEWEPTPRVEHQLQHLNSFLLKSTDGWISPIL